MVRGRTGPVEGWCGEVNADKVRCSNPPGGSRGGSSSTIWPAVSADQLTDRIGRLTTRIEDLIAAIPAAQGADADGTTGPGAGRGADAAVLPAVDRLDEITGIGREGAQAITAEIGLKMSTFPPPLARCPGPSSPRAPSSPGPPAAAGAPVRETPT